MELSMMRLSYLRHAHLLAKNEQYSTRSRRSIRHFLWIMQKNHTNTFSNPGLVHSTSRKPKKHFFPRCMRNDDIISALQRNDELPQTGFLLQRKTSILGWTFFQIRHLAMDFPKIVETTMRNFSLLSKKITLEDFFLRISTLALSLLGFSSTREIRWSTTMVRLRQIENFVNIWHRISSSGKLYEKGRGDDVWYMTFLVLLLQMRKIHLSSEWQNLRRNLAEKSWNSVRNISFPFPRNIHFFSWYDE